MRAYVLIYGIMAWGNKYPTTLQPLHILQKKAMQIITISAFDAHTTPLIRLLNNLKLADLVTLNKYHNNLLSCYFDTFFNLVSDIHSYNTRSAAKQLLLA